MMFIRRKINKKVVLAGIVTLMFVSCGPNNAGDTGASEAVSETAENTALSTEYTGELSDDGVAETQAVIESVFTGKPLMYSLFNNMHALENSAIAFYPELRGFYDTDGAAIGACHLLEHYTKAVKDGTFSNYAAVNDSSLSNFYFDGQYIFCEWLLATNHAFEQLSDEERLEVVTAVYASYCARQGSYQTEVYKTAAWPGFLSGFINYVKEAYIGGEYYLGDDTIGFNEQGSEWYDYIMDLPAEYGKIKGLIYTGDKES